MPPAATSQNDGRFSLPHSTVRASAQSARLPENHHLTGYQRGEGGDRTEREATAGEHDREQSPRDGVVQVVEACSACTRTVDEISGRDSAGSVPHRSLHRAARTTTRSRPPLRASRCGCVSRMNTVASTRPTAAHPRPTKNGSGRRPARAAISPAAKAAAATPRYRPLRDPHREPAPRAPDEVDLHDHERGRRQPVVDAEDEVRGPTRIRRRPHQQERNGHADDPAGDHHGLAADPVAEPAGGEVRHRLRQPERGDERDRGRERAHPEGPAGKDGKDRALWPTVPPTSALTATRNRNCARLTRSPSRTTRSDFAFATLPQR